MTAISTSAVMPGASMATTPAATLHKPSTNGTHQSVRVERCWIAATIAAAPPTSE
jgi:hypothetical protein